MPYSQVVTFDRPSNSPRRRCTTMNTSCTASATSLSGTPSLRNDRQTKRKCSSYTSLNEVMRSPASGGGGPGGGAPTRLPSAPGRFGRSVMSTRQVGGEDLASPSPNRHPKLGVPGTPGGGGVVSDLIVHRELPLIERNHELRPCPP